MPTKLDAMCERKKKSFSIITLGCPKNEVDSDYVSAILQDAGLIKVSEAEDANLIIVNTCSFINDAKEESIETVLELAQIKDDRKLVLMGCMAEQFGKELFDEIPEVDAVIGNRNLSKSAKKIHEVLNDDSGRILETGGEYKFWYSDSAVQIPETFPFAYLKIAEGCNNRCSYCTIPTIRGHYRSLPREMIMQQASGLIDHGFREIILVAQDTTEYGRDIYGDNYKISDLIADIDRIPGDFYIRIMYTNPAKINQDLIDALKLDHVIKYLDMPVQHVSDNVLKSMNRHMTNEKIMSTIEALKSQIPSIALRTTVMTGFPSETDADFKQLVDFVGSNQFLHLGAFAFSPQDGTPAYNMDGEYDEDLAIERRDILDLIQMENYAENNRSLIGNIVKVIIDRRTLRDGFYMGRTLQDAPEIDRQVKIHGDAKPGDIVDALILRTFEYKMLASII